MDVSTSNHVVHHGLLLRRPFVDAADHIHVLPLIWTPRLHLTSSRSLGCPAGA